MTVSEVNHVVIKSILEIPNKIHKHATTSKEILSHIKQASVKKNIDALFIWITIFFYSELLFFFCRSWLNFYNC